LKKKGGKYENKTRKKITKARTQKERKILNSGNILANTKTEPKGYQL
jgi:hypothetical protein